MLSQVRQHKYYTLFVTILLVFAINVSVSSAKKVKWEKSLEKGMAEAKRAGKPMIMDFFAVW